MQREKPFLSLNTEKSVTLKTLRQELVNKLCLDDSFFFKYKTTPLTLQQEHITVAKIARASSDGHTYDVSTTIKMPQEGQTQFRETKIYKTKSFVKLEHQHLAPKAKAKSASIHAR